MKQYQNSDPKPGKKQKKRRGLPSKQRSVIYAQVIERDKICQNPSCSDGWPLEAPHHITFKSQYGLDTEENLITLCVACHRKIHHTAELKVTGEYGNLKWEKIR